jgi:hypothetical protein
MSLYHLANQAADNPAKSPLRRPVPAGGVEVEPPTPPPPAPDSNTLAGLTKYIPTETVTLYVATFSAQAALSDAFGKFAPAWAYWIFLTLTPLLVLLLFFRRLKLNPPPSGTPRPPWPWWPMAAAAIAFAVWALAVPGNEIIPDKSGTLAAFGALVVSTILNLVAPFFEPQPAA